MDSDPSEVGVVGEDIVYGHGTHVAGIIALAAPDAKIMPIRVLDHDGQGNLWVLAEALLYASRMGAEPARVIEAISAGMAGSKMLDLMGPKMAARDFVAGIEARLHAKDIAMVTGTMRDLGIEMPATEVAHRQLARLVDLGWGHDDTSSLLRVLEAAIGGGVPRAE